MNKIQFQNIIIITFIYRHVCTLHSFLSANHRSITNIPFIPPDSKEIRHFQLVYHVCASSITQRFIFQYFTTIFFINLRHILFILSRKYSHKNYLHYKCSSVRHALPVQYSERHTYPQTKSTARSLSFQTGDFPTRKSPAN